MNNKKKQLRGLQDVTLVGYKDFELSDDILDILSKSKVKEDYVFYFNYIFIKKQYYKYNNKQNIEKRELNLNIGIDFTSQYLKRKIPNYSTVIDSVTFTKRSKSSGKIYNRVPYEEGQCFKYCFVQEKQPKLKFIKLKNNIILSKLYSETLKYESLRHIDSELSKDLQEVSFLFEDYNHLTIDQKKLSTYLDDLLDKKEISYAKYVHSFIIAMDIINGYYKFKRDNSKDGRLHSSFQSASKICRQFMALDKKGLYEVDISAGVPTILAYYLTRICDNLQCDKSKNKFINKNYAVWSEKLKKFFEEIQSKKTSFTDTSENSLNLSLNVSNSRLIKIDKEGAEVKSIEFNHNNEATPCLNHYSYPQYMFQKLTLPTSTHSNIVLERSNVQCNRIGLHKVNNSCILKKDNENSLLISMNKGMDLLGNVMAISKENVESCLYVENTFFYENIDYNLFKNELEDYKILIETDTLYRNIELKCLDYIHNLISDEKLKLLCAKDKLKTKIEKRISYYENMKKDILDNPKNHIKRSFLAMLNSKHNEGRYKVEREVFASMFPIISEVVKQMKNVDSEDKHKLFSKLVLQKEGEIMLTKVAKEFKEKNKECKLLTLHDCAITTHEYIIELKNYMKSRLSALLGMSVNVKDKQLSYVN